MKALEWPQNFSHYRSMRFFPVAQGKVSPQYEIRSLIRDCIVVFVTCTNEDPIKNDGSRVATRLYVNFSDAQGQIIP